MQITIKNPIKLGQRRAFTITTANGVGRQPNGAIAVASVIDGDSSAPTINADSTDKKITGFIFGDGSLGEHKVRIHLDTQVGKAVEGKTPRRAAQDIDITYSVTCPECDEVKFAEVGADEDLPIGHERSYMRH